MKKFAVLCSSAALLFAACAEADVTVGVSLSSTGPGAGLGIPEKNAIALLPTEIAGEKIRYVVLDDESDPSVATRNARKLVSEDRVDLLLGSSVTPATLAMAEVAMETGTPLLAISPVRLPEDKDHWVFRTPQKIDVMATALVSHMRDTGVKTLGFIGYSDAYGDDWLAAMEPLLAPAGIRLVSTQRYHRTDTSVNGQTLKLIATRPDAILVVASGSPAALPQTTLAARGYRGQIYQTHAAANPAFLRVAGKAAEGAILPIGPVVVVGQLPESHPSREIGLHLVADYEALYGPGTFSAFAGHVYDAGLLLAAALPDALAGQTPGSDGFRAALRDALEADREVTASHGVYHMSPADHFGLDQRGRVLVSVHNGSYQMLTN